MRVGIITIHSVPNYGAVLQAYALAKHLHSIGLDAQTVDYRQPDLEKLYRGRWKFPPPVNNWLRLRRNAAFVVDRLPLSRRRYHSLDEFLPAVQDYDAFITGSDQVWFTGPVQFFDRMFFLDFPAPGKRKISYGASAGGTTDFGQFRSRVAATLSEYHRIGVRDSHTYQLVAPLVPRTPVQVVDPVFLCDFAALLDDRSTVVGPYILVFGDFSGKLDPALRAIIGATGIRNVVSLQYHCDPATLRLAAPSPTQWLNCFKHASFVVTTYFHGAAFAAKFERPFISIPTPGRRIKVSTMLDWMGLQERCVLEDPTSEVCADLARRGIDWELPRKILSRRIADSKLFLADALSNDG